VILRIMMDVSLRAALWLSQAVEPDTRQRGSGTIAHVPARPGTDPTTGMAAYSLSKPAPQPSRPVPAHAVRPEAAVDIIAFLVSDRAGPVSGAVVPACGA
jgi:hypothetical protein